jgi:hypothetical protein
MRPSWQKAYKWCVVMSTGGVTLGILQGLQGVNFAQFWTNWLSQLLSVLVTILFGGDPTNTNPFV